MVTTLGPVENRTGDGLPLGPAPRRTSSRRHLTRAQSAVVDRLRAQPEPVSLASLVALTHQHENTLREHLQELERRRVVRRSRAPIRGRGRPPWLYELVDEEPAEYAGLAASLAASIAHCSDDPARDATAAGREWGLQMARQREALPHAPHQARTQVLDVLDELGFAPRDDPDGGDVIRLTVCPLLEAAYRHPEVVCGVHLGIVTTLLGEYGGTTEGVALRPFAEPGACLLTVPRDSAGRTARC